MVLIKISQGKLEGSETKSDNGVTYYEFLLVPYAKPPVGNLRFRNPQPPEPWDGIRDATIFKENNISCQVDLFKRSLIGSEDCLYLNVFTPKLPDSSSKPLPVMLYIHGGGFNYLNGIDKQELGPDYLIENDVVVVTINYRLNVLGFLSLDIPEATGNMGLKDQVQALKWVQSNIDKFGGDPNNVTIFGLSAGGVSVDYHLLSPLSKGLFHKAILHSGSCLNHWAINYEPKKLIEKLLENMGYSGSTEDDRAIYEYLLNSSASLLIEASVKAAENFTSNKIYVGFVPTIEKDYGDGQAMLTDTPYKLFKEGRFNHVPIIKGFCNKEGYLTQATKPNAVPDLLTKKNFMGHWSYQIEDSDISKYNASFLEAYTENIEPEDDDDKMAVDFFSHFDFVSGVYLTADIASKGVPVYLYEFCYDGNINYLKKLFGIMRKGAAHGDDISYAFKNTVSQFGDGKDFEIREKVCKMLTNFAKTNNPTPHNDDEASIQWPEYKNDSRLYLCIDENFIIKSNYEPKKMSIFKEIYEKYEK